LLDSIVDSTKKYIIDSMRENINIIYITNIINVYFCFKRSGVMSNKAIVVGLNDHEGRHILSVDTAIVYGSPNG